MKFFILGLFLSLIIKSAWAVKLSDYRPYAFEALFTNPVCETYNYDRPLISFSGDTILSKPKNVYCKQSDEAASVARATSPQYRLTEWILDKQTKELYLAYLSFSSRNIINALCTAIGRGVKVSLILDGGSDQRTNPSAEGLKKCGVNGLVAVHYRGSTGGLGFAHNKIMMVNPGKDIVKIVFSSGNMSAGTSTHHENWNFVTTAGASFFAQVHQCAVEGMILAGDRRGSFSAFMGECRSKIKAAPESDIQVFFAPTDGKQALAKIKEAISRAKLTEVIAHRLSGIVANLLSDKLDKNKKMKLVLDDDVYWSAKLKKDIGRNSKSEAFKVYNDLINKGMETRFLETNEKVFQLQHNKFMVFTFDQGGAVFSGAGNFTTSAFTKNFENFYYILIPEVVKAYKKQYAKYFDELGTAAEDMPRNYVLP
jgi:hypothetical protein